VTDLVARYFRRKERAYRTLFGESEAAKIVLADLCVTCGASRSSFSRDGLEMARLEGRREIFNHIMTYLKVDYEDYQHLIKESFDDEF